MYIYKDLIEYIISSEKFEGYMFYEPVSEKKVKQVVVETDNALTDMGKKEGLPIDYLEFLVQADGFDNGNVSWYGFRNHVGRYKTYNIVKKNELYKDAKEFKNKIIIGNFGEDHLMYDFKDKTYQKVNYEMGKVYKNGEFGEFKELFLKVFLDLLSKNVVKELEKKIYVLNEDLKVRE
jgi:hypothetical protein